MMVGNRGLPLAQDEQGRSVLAAKNHDIVTLWESFAIANNTLNLSAVADVSMYKNWMFIVRNTLDKEVNFQIFDTTKRTSGQSTINIYSEGSFTSAPTSIKIPASSTVSRIINANAMPWLERTFLEGILVGLQCTEVPTTGSISVYLVGVPN